MADEAAEFVAGKLADRNSPVLVFALEWCEFCWSVRKFMTSRELEYQAVELDSVAFQKDLLGRRIRDHLESLTGMNTIPQIFIAGEFVGGCTDMFDGWKSGAVQSLLKRHDIAFRNDVESDPYSFLPEWLHPR